MADIVDLDPIRRRQQRARLADGGGGGDDGGMLDQRVAALEADMREVKGILGRIEKKLDQFDDRLRRVELDVAEMKGRVAQLPTAWTLLTGGAGLILATFGFAFALVRFGIPH